MGFLFTLGFWQTGSAMKIALVLKKLDFHFSCFQHNYFLTFFHQTLNLSHFFAENVQMKNFVLRINPNSLNFFSIFNQLWKTHIFPKMEFFSIFDFSLNFEVETHIFKNGN